MMEKKIFRGNIALKIDIKKAFNTVDWKFMLQVLHTFGIDDKFCYLVKVNLQSAKLSIVVNGHPAVSLIVKGEFHQDDALSLLLFCIANDVLSRAITCLVQSSTLLSTTSLRGC